MTVLDRILWNLSVAGSALELHRGRSVLATAGVAIGIGSVIIMAAIGAGLREQISTGVDALGSNVVFVLPGESGAGQAAHARLLDADLRAARTLGGEAVEASGQFRTQATVATRAASVGAAVVGADRAFGRVSGMRRESGRMLNDDDIDRARMVAVIDPALATDLDLPGPPVGQTLSIAGRPFKIIGVMGGKPGASQGTVLIPLSTMRQRIPGAGARPQTLTSILVSVAPGSDGESVATALAMRLRKIRSLAPSDDLPLRVSTSAEFARQADSVVGALQAGLVAIASVSLFVGAIGVMNIMLVAVRERTSEIGLRLAVGATPRDILEQFLTEAALLCLIGGAIGVLIGGLTSALISLLSGWNAWPSPFAVVAAIFVSVAVGMAAGIMPATAAARLPPIVAIRRD